MAYIWPVCGTALAGAMYMKGLGDVFDIITCAKFQSEIFKGYYFRGGRIFHFPIDFWMGLTTVQRYSAAVISIEIDYTSPTCEESTPATDRHKMYFLFHCNSWNMSWYLSKETFNNILWTLVERTSYMVVLFTIFVHILCIKNVTKLRNLHRQGMCIVHAAVGFLT